VQALTECRTVIDRIVCRHNGRFVSVPLVEVTADAGHDIALDPGCFHVRPVNAGRDR